MSSVRIRHPARERDSRVVMSRHERPGGPMRAAILTAYNEPLVIEDVTAPEIGPHDVLVHIDASGVCHSDLSFANGSVPLPPPVILGHEGAGTVLAVGNEVSRVKLG